MVLKGSGMKTARFVLIASAIVVFPIACSNPLVEAVVAAQSAAVWSRVIASPATEATANHAVTLSWPETPEASSYNLYWSTSPNPTKSSATKIEGVTSPYIHSGLTNKINYYYFITALSAGAESGSSAVTSAMPMQLVAYVTNYSALNSGVGLNAYTINPVDGTLTAIPGSLSLAGDVASSITVDPFSKYLYISDWDTAFSPTGKGGEVFTCLINSNTGALSFPGSGYTVSTSTPAAGDIAVDPTGKFAYVLNSPGSTQGSVNAYTISATDGTLSPVIGYTPLTTGGAYGQADGIAVDPTGKFVYATSNNFGGYPGTIAGYNINTSTGVLTATAWGTFTPGSPYLGASSIVFSPTGNFYVGEGTSSLVVEAYTRPNANGLPVINGQYGPVGQNSRLLAIDPQGRFLYSISTSFHSISALKINTDGTLGVAMGPYDASSGTIRYPQEIVVDPTGHFVYALIFDGNSPYTGAVCIYRIDQSTGALTLTSIDTSVGNYPQAMAVGSLP